MAFDEALPGTKPVQHGSFVFGDFKVDLDRGSLMHQGEEIAVRPKPFAVLVYLLEHAGRLVPRDELMEAVWPGVVVTDDSISQCLIELRKALGDDDRTMIRTVPRRGLIFDVPVRAELSHRPATSPRTGPARQRAWIVGAALVAGAVLLSWWLTGPPPATPPESPDRKSVAVLRFADMSPPPGYSYLADGLSEEILHMLAQSASLSVIARTSSFAVEDLPVDAIAKQLGVRYVLEGSIRREGDQVRITAQLIDARTSTHLWSRSYDRGLQDLVALQKEIASAVAGELRAHLGDQPDTPGIGARAYERFLEAKFFYDRRAEGDRLRAERRLKEVLAREPEFARGWALLAAVAAARLGDPTAGVNDPAERTQLLNMQRHAVEQALKFGPGLPESNHRAAQYYFYNGEPARALELVETARSINPDHPLVLVALAYDLRNSGRVPEAGRVVRLNVQQDPLNLVLRAELIRDLLWSGRFGDVRAQFDTIVEFDPAAIREAPFLGQFVVQADILRGDFDAASSVIEMLPDGSERLQAVALRSHALGHPEAAETALASLSSSAHGSRDMLRVAEVHAYRQDPETAMAWLNRIEYRRDCKEVGLWQSVYYSPFLARLGDEPGWMGYRAEALQIMQGCRLGLQLESVNGVSPRPR